MFNNTNDRARVARHIDAMLYKKATAHVQSQAFLRYDQAGLQALQRAMVPPCLARSMWASMHRQGWRPGVEAPRWSTSLSSIRHGERCERNDSYASSGCTPLVK